MVNYPFHQNSAKATFYFFLLISADIDISTLFSKQMAKALIVRVSVRKNSKKLKIQKKMKISRTNFLKNPQKFFKKFFWKNIVLEVQKNFENITKI